MAGGNGGLQYMLQSYSEAEGPGAGGGGASTSLSIAPKNMRAPWSRASSVMHCVRTDSRSRLPASIAVRSSSICFCRSSTADCCCDVAPLYGSLLTRTQVFDRNFITSALVIAENRDKRNAARRGILELLPHLVCFGIEIDAQSLASLRADGRALRRRIESDARRPVQTLLLVEDDRSRVPS